MDIGHLKHGLVIKATKLRTWILWGSVTDIHISPITQFLYVGWLEGKESEYVDAIIMYKLVY
ncbi:hypothetical protein [Peribacillus butanolivorans]|uniref:hypothetical protein n=1 Tax=Peribacillus butanolivorans TaxID=421767 RepID=UPI0035E0A4E5